MTITSEISSFKEVLEDNAPEIESLLINSGADYRFKLPKLLTHIGRIKESASKYGINKAYELSFVLEDSVNRVIEYSLNPSEPVIEKMLNCNDIFLSLLEIPDEDIEEILNNENAIFNEFTKGLQNSIQDEINKKIKGSEDVITETENDIEETPGADESARLPVLQDVIKKATANLSGSVSLINWINAETANESEAIGIFRNLAEGTLIINDDQLKLFFEKIKDGKPAAEGELISYLEANIGNFGKYNRDIYNLLKYFFSQNAAPADKIDEIESNAGMNVLICGYPGDHYAIPLKDIHRVIDTFEGLSGDIERLIMINADGIATLDSDTIKILPDRLIVLKKDNTYRYLIPGQIFEIEKIELKAHKSDSELISQGQILNSGKWLKVINTCALFDYKL